MLNLVKEIRKINDPHLLYDWVKSVLVFDLLAILIGVLGGILIIKINQPVYILLGLIFIGVFGSSIFYVDFGLLVLVGLVYTRVSDALNHDYGIPSVLQIYIVLLFCGILGRWVLYREMPKGWIKGGALFSLYGLVCIVSLFIASDASVTMTALNNLLKDAIIMILVLVLLRKGTSFQQVVWMLIGVGIFLGTISCIQFLTKTFTNTYGGFASARIMEISGTTDDYRIGGPVSDANYFALIMVVIVILALERFLHEHRSFYRFIALWGLIVTLLCVVFSYSRGGFISLLAALTIFFFIYPPRFFQVPIIIMSLIAISFFLPPKYFDRIFSLNQFFHRTQPGEIQTNDSSFRDRAAQNLVAYEMIKSNPLFGIGLSNYRTDFNIYASRLGVSIGGLASAHNLYLEVAAETGFLGLFTFIALITNSLRITWKSYSAFLRAGNFEYAGMAIAFGIGFFGYLVGSIFIHGAYPRYFYLLVGIGYSLENVVREMLNIKGFRKYP